LTWLGTCLSYEKEIPEAYGALSLLVQWDGTPSVIIMHGAKGQTKGNLVDKRLVIFILRKYFIKL